MNYQSSTITSCEARSGGGMYITTTSATITVTDVHMVLCSASEGGGGVSAIGDADINLISVGFWNCSAGEELSNDIALDNGASTTCTPTCTAGTFAATDPWECSNPYQAVVYDFDSEVSVDDCMPYCLSAVQDCEVCGADKYLSASEITADGNAQCGEWLSPRSEAVN